MVIITQDILFWKKRGLSYPIIYYIRSFFFTGVGKNESVNVLYFKMGWIVFFFKLNNIFCFG